MIEEENQLPEQLDPTDSQALGAVAIEHAATLTGGWESRAREIEQIIDPDRTLPEIELRVDLESEGGKAAAAEGAVKKLAYDSSGAEVGVICTRPSKDDKSVTEVTYVNTSRPGLGYGMAMYLSEIKENISQGKTLTNDPTGVSHSAIKIWEKLHALGVAIEEQPFAIDESYSNAYKGRYIIPPSK